MSHNVNWDVTKYRGESEDENVWQLKEAFLVKWKDRYPEDKLVCLAHVFINIEFMGCQYPNETMREVAYLSADVASDHRARRKERLQRSFVSASDAAADRARGVKRVAGVVKQGPKQKTAKIEFMREGQSEPTENNDLSHEEKDETEIDSLCNKQMIKTKPCPNIVMRDDSLLQQMIKTKPCPNIVMKDNPSELKPISGPLQDTSLSPQPKALVPITTDKKDKQQIKSGKEFKVASNFSKINYIQEMIEYECLDPRDFNDTMFKTEFGSFVLFIRPWNDMITNLINSCAATKSIATQGYKNGCFTVTLNEKILAEVHGDKTSAKDIACRIVWEKLRPKTVILVLKEQWIPQNNLFISASDMAASKYEFGEPIEDSVAMKMMKLMGWKGGGLGADSQGISEPIRPHLRMISRAGLGHDGSRDLRLLRQKGMNLMRRRGIALDADLVFGSDFSKEERAVLHLCANHCRLQSKSYGKGEARFLVVTNKLRPFALVCAVLAQGGETAKYRVFIPATIDRRSVH